MGICALPIMDSELQIPMRGWKVIPFTRVRYEYACFVLASHRESDCIGIPVRRQARAVRRVPQAAALLEHLRFRRDPFVTRGCAVPIPSRAQR
jgi:hypothetical protein